MENLAGVDDLPQPIAGFAGATDRLQQFEQIGFGARAGIFAQSRPERRMAKRALPCQARNIGGEKGEGPLGVLAVFGKIEMHAPDMPPPAVARGEKPVQIETAFCALDVKGIAEQTPQFG